MQKRGLNYKFAYFSIIGILLFFAIFLLVVINQSTQVSFSPLDNFDLFDDFTQNITSNQVINQSSINGVVWDGQSSYMPTLPTETSSGMQGLIGLWHFNTLSILDPPYLEDSGPYNLNANCPENGCPMLIIGDDKKLGAGSLNFSENSTYGQRSLFVYNSPAFNNIVNELTVSAWVKPFNKVGGGAQFIVGKKQGNGIRSAYALFISGQAPRFRMTSCSDVLTDVGLGSSLNLNFGQWYHVVGTFNNSANRANLYVDGVLVDSVVTTQDLCTSNNQTLEIGGTSNPVEVWFNGFIDEVVLLNKTLTNNEINSLYLDGLGRDSGSFASKNIDTGETFYSLKANWTENNNDIKLKISGNGADYCDASNGQTLVAPNCGFPSNDFIYLVNLTNKAKINSLLISTNSTVNLLPISSISPNNQTLVRSPQIYFTAVLYDEAGLTNATLELNGLNYNLNQTVSLSGQSALVNISVTLPSEGVYIWRYKIRDSNNNLEQTAYNEFYYYTQLLININSPKPISYNTTSVFFNVSLSKNGSAKFSLNNGQSNITMQSSNNRDFTYNQTSLAEDDYTFRLYANENNYNTNFSTVDFEIDLPGSPAASGTGGSSGGGSGGSSGGSSSNSPGSGTTNIPNEWDNSIDRSDQELSQFGPLFIPLGVNERVLVLINGENHYVGVKQISNNLVSVEIASTPVKVDLEIGETWRVDGDSNGVYDFSVKVAGVAAGFADLEIKAISEEVKAGDLEQQSSSVVGEDAKINFAFILIWVAVGILILAIFLVIRHLRRKNAGFKKLEPGSFEIKNADDLEIDLR